jgi:hypothetical protein
MKRLLILFAVLCSLLGLTWFLTETGIFEKKTPFEEALHKELKNIKSYTLPVASLSQDMYGIWRTSAGEVVRSELLDELHRSLESISISRVINHFKNPTERVEYFPTKDTFKLNNIIFEWGSLSPSGDSFYLGIQGHPEVYVADLTAMGSLAVGDNENVLMQAKYQRLRDLIFYPERGWQETRLLPLLQMYGFKHWRKGTLKLDGDILAQRSWGEEIKKFFIAALQSLEVQGEIIKVKPQGDPAFASWVFESVGEAMVWEFYEHKNIDIIYVWIPSLAKGYPLNGESSELLQKFPERFVDRPFSMTLNPLSENMEVFHKGDLIKTKSPVYGALMKFFQLKQNFDHLTFLSVKDCNELKTPLEVRVNSTVYNLRKVTGGWAIMDCELGLVWTWSLPLESDMDFDTLNL